MQYLIDAQLPKKLAQWLVEQGYQATHTLDLPKKNATPDSEIIRIASDDATLIVVTKDKDFPEQRIIRGIPERILWITTGNIRNSKLFELFQSEFSTISSLFEGGSLFVELSNDAITVHE